MSKLDLNSLIGKRISCVDSWYTELFSFVVDSIMVDSSGLLYCRGGGTCLHVTAEMIYSLIAYGSYVDSSYIDFCYVTKTYKIVEL